KDLGFASAYVFGAVCPVEGKAAALIMPVCNTAAMNHHLSEISSQVAAPRFREGRLYPCRGDPRSCRLAPKPGSRGARQYHFVGAAALQPGAQSSRADLALSARPLARQLGVYQPGGHHGCLRDGLEPVRHQPRPDPLALRGRLGSSFVRSIGSTSPVLDAEMMQASDLVQTMLIRLTPKHPVGSLAAETRCRHARRCSAPRGSALSGFTARVSTPLS